MISNCKRCVHFKEVKLLINWGRELVSVFRIKGDTCCRGYSSKIYDIIFGTQDFKLPVTEKCPNLRVKVPIYI